MEDFVVVLINSILSMIITFYYYPSKGGDLRGSGVALTLLVITKRRY